MSVQFSVLFIFVLTKCRLPENHQNLCIILELLIYFVLSNQYDAVTRSFLIRFSAKLGMTYSELVTYERNLLCDLHAITLRLSKDNEKLNDKAKASKPQKKWLKIGLAAAVAGVTALVAAPILLPVAFQAAAGIAGIVGGTASTAIISTSTFLASSTGLSILTAGFVVGGAGYGGKKMANRLSSDVDMTIVDSEMNVVDDTWTAVPETYDIMLINGLLDSNGNVSRLWGLHPSYSWWRTDFSGGHVYYLDWENELLRRITTMILDTAVGHRLILDIVVSVRFHVVFDTSCQSNSTSWGVCNVSDSMGFGSSELFR